MNSQSLFFPGWIYQYHGEQVTLSKVHQLKCLSHPKTPLQKYLAAYLGAVAQPSWLIKLTITVALNSEGNRGVPHWPADDMTWATVTLNQWSLLLGACHTHRATICASDWKNTDLFGIPNQACAKTLCLPLDPKVGGEIASFPLPAPHQLCSFSKVGQSKGTGLKITLSPESAGVNSSGSSTVKAHSSGAYKPVLSCLPPASRRQEVSCCGKSPVSSGYCMWLQKPSALAPASRLFLRGWVAVGQLCLRTPNALSPSRDKGSLHTRLFLKTSPLWPWELHEFFPLSETVWPGLAR